MVYMEERKVEKNVRTWVKKERHKLSCEMLPRLLVKITLIDLKVPYEAWRQHLSPSF